MSTPLNLDPAVFAPSSLEELRAGICRDSFYDFVQEFWPEISHETPIWNWHIPYLCQEVQLVAERIFAGLPALYDLVINISPGTSKSSVVSVMLPVWCWTRMPSFRSICGSYTHLLALDLSRKSRDIVRSDKFRLYYPDILLRDDQATKGYFANDSGGMRYAVGVCGSVLGMHAHLLLPDDPVDPLQVHSEADLKTVHYWMDQILPSRKVDKEVSAMIMIMQRLAEDDPTGHLLAKPGRPVKHICLPAEVTEHIEPPELRERYIEGLMDPIRMSRAVLNRERLARGEFDYARQFLQSPVPLAGGLFKITFFNKRLPAAPYNANRVRYWDLASSSGEASCHTAGTLLARDGKGDWFVEHVIVGHWEPRERLEQMQAIALRDRAKYGPRYEPDIVVEHEGGSSGIDAYKYLAGQMAGYRIYPDRPSGSKEDRARPFAAQCAAGNVYLIQDTSWAIDDWIKELCAFPSTKLRDRVDSSSGAFHWLLSKKPAGTIHVYQGRKRAKDKPRIVVCSREQLANLLIEERALWVSIRDPDLAEEVMTNELHVSAQSVWCDGNDRRMPNPLQDHIAQGVGTNGASTSTEAVHTTAPGGKPPHALAKLIDWLPLQFADLDPKDLQERWDQPLPPWHRLPQELVLTRDQCRKLWGFLTRQRPTEIQCYIFQDEGDNRAKSLALAYVKIKGWEPNLIEVVGTEETLREPGNPFLYDLVKSTRSMVV